MALLAIELSVVAVTIDRMLDIKPSQIFGFLYISGPQEARSILSTIAGSVLGVAGVAFSITIVVLTLATSQFGPRLLRNFMKDRGNQVVFGTFISTFIYCLLVLRSVDEAGGQLFVPNFSVTLGVVLALVSAGVLIYFIHHVSDSIQADKVIASVYSELLVHMQRLFPEELGHEFGEENKNDRGGLQPSEDCGDHAHHIVSSQDGYLQAIDSDGLLKIAEKNDLLVCVDYRPGEYVVAGSMLAAVKSPEKPDERLAGQIVDSFILGPQRTPEQDAEFTVNQLVEIAVRALSPGINDPFTAISCIDRLGSALCYLTGRAFPSPYRYDEKGELRVIVKTVTFGGITNAAFDQIRQYGRTSVAVTIRLLETLILIAALSRSQEQRYAVLRQAQMVVRGGQEALPEENDRQDVRDRYNSLLDMDSIAYLTAQKHSM